MRVAIDWDGCLVDENQNWLPGALDGLRWLKRDGHKIVIHSARANWKGGLEEIEAKLARHKFSFKVLPKPDADLYVDDRGLRFTRWPETISEVRKMKRA